MRTLLLSAGLVLVTLASSANAQTQITTGVIQGVVTDTTGAVMPGVTVEARNLETNLSRSVVTGTDGRFVLLQLPSGTYTVTYTLAGFATLVQENIGVTVGQAVTLAATMRVSALAETVRVDAAAPVVEGSPVLMVEVVPLAYMRGRAQPLHCKVLTPAGFREIGTLRIGEEVIGSDGTAKSRDVKIGIKNSEDVQIVSGLKAGEQVVTEGAYGLKDNTKVKVEKPSPEGSEDKGKDKDKDKEDKGKEKPGSE